MPVAPSIYNIARQLPSGRIRHKALEIDVLALTGQRQAQIKLPSQSLGDRLTVCSSIAAVGALFERYGLVYLDWSYANVLWSLFDHSAYVIDLDGCSFGPCLQIHSPNWEDPLRPRGLEAGNESDRYRVALLVARCLTGIRADLANTMDSLDRLSSYNEAMHHVVELLAQALYTENTKERPPVTTLKAALENARGCVLRSTCLGRPNEELTL